MIELERYTPSAKADWDRAVMQSRNGDFLFMRDYMDYHQARFRDYSFLIRRNGRIEGVLPGNIDGKVWYSHQGLSFGGILISSKVHSADVLELFDCLEKALYTDGIEKVVYKPIPWIYPGIPAQEDLYALFLRSSRLKERRLSSSIDCSNRLAFSESRKGGIRKARRCNIQIVESNEYLPAFWRILEENLRQKYQSVPVHSLDEIMLLARRFPENIRLFTAHEEEEVVGGCLFYLFRNVVHCQYISASVKGKADGALDLLFQQAVERYQRFRFFDFGTSTENGGRVLNKALIFQKEGFGGRGIAYDVYEFDIVVPEKLIFSDFTEDFLALSSTWLRDPEICRLTATPPFSAEEQQTWFKSLAARKDYRIWGIHCGSRKIGACGLKNISDKSAEYWGYIGEKEFWGRGLGKRLVSYCIEKARELGLSSLCLRVISENTRARRLYLASGFQESGREADMLIMTLSL